MTMRAGGTCRNDPCGQSDLLWADGYCSEDCREQVTGCPVPLCGCERGCGCSSATTTRQVDGDDGP